MSLNNWVNRQFASALRAVIAGVKPGIEFVAPTTSATNIAENLVHQRDRHATMLHILGIDHKQFTYPFRGLESKLTGVEEAHVVRGILS